MTGETMAVIGMGLAIIGLNWRMYAVLRADNAAMRSELDAKIGAMRSDLDAKIGALQADVSGVKERLAGVETTLALLIKGLHIEVSGRGG